MFEYTITLEVTINQANIELKIYPVVKWRTSVKDRCKIEQVAVYRYIQDNWGSLTDVKAVWTSVEKIREVA